MRLRLPILAGLALVLLAGAAFALYWFWAADQLARAIAQWTQEQRARGYDVAYGGPEIHGFPIKLAVRFTEPRIAAPQGWRWSGGAIAGEAAFWEPRLLRLDLPRRQRLIAAWRGHSRALALDAEAARGLVHLDRGGWIKAATMEMENLALRAQAGWTTRADTLRYAVTRRPPARDGTSDWTLALSGEATGVTPPRDIPDLFGERIERLAFDATLNGMIPPGGPAQALARWRDAGGLLEVNELAMRWGPLDLRADGTATLDALLRPQGAFAARIRGLPEAIDALADRGLIEPKTAFVIRATALTLAAGQDETGHAVIRLPITLQDGLFYLGPVALFSLAPVL